MSRNRLLQRIGLTPHAIKRALLTTATAVEQPRRRAAILQKGKCGRRGLPRGLTDQMYADYQRLGSIAAVAPLYGRTRQAMWQIFRSHGYVLKPGAKARTLPGAMTFDGVLYTPSGRDGQLRATMGKRRMLLRTVIWEKANGQLPRGWVVAAKDGNPLNVALENLLAGPRAAVTRHYLVKRFPTMALSPEERVARRRRVALAWYYRRREAYRAKGLRSDGKFPRRRLSAAVRAEHERARNLKKFQARAEGFVQAGLTTRGTRPRRGRTATEAAYEALKAEIVANPTEFPLATGFRDEASHRSGQTGAINGRGFMNNLITRGTEAA